jgi:hypothetical protein
VSFLLLTFSTTVLDGLRPERRKTSLFEAKRSNRASAAQVPRAPSFSTTSETVPLDLSLHTTALLTCPTSLAWTHATDSAIATAIRTHSTSEGAAVQEPAQQFFEQLLYFQHPSTPPTLVRVELLYRDSVCLTRINVTE